MFPQKPGLREAFQTSLILVGERGWFSEAPSSPLLSFFLPGIESKDVQVSAALGLELLRVRLGVEKAA